MTCILITRSAIYTDTLHMGETDEVFHSLTKVKPMRDIARVKWTALESEPVSDESNCASFVDNIHGYTCSGNNKIADLFIKSLFGEASSAATLANPNVKLGGLLKTMLAHDLAVNLNDTLEFYKAVAVAGFVNAATHGTVVLIGEKACYGFELTSRGAYVGRISRDNPVSYGTGAAYASKVLYTTGDPLLAMYTAMWYDDDSTGGMIDIWQMPTVEVPVLCRIGVCNHRSLIQIKEILAAPVTDDPLHPDLVSAEAMTRHLKAAAKRPTPAPQTSKSGLSSGAKANRASKRLPAINTGKNPTKSVLSSPTKRRK